MNELKTQMQSLSIYLSIYLSLALSLSLQSHCSGKGIGEIARSEKSLRTTLPFHTRIEGRVRVGDLAHFNCIRQDSFLCIPNLQMLLQVLCKARQNIG